MTLKERWGDCLFRGLTRTVDSSDGYTKGLQRKRWKRTPLEKLYWVGSNHSKQWNIWGSQSEGLGPAARSTFRSQKCLLHAAPPEVPTTCSSNNANQGIFESAASTPIMFPKTANHLTFGGLKQHQLFIFDFQRSEVKTSPERWKPSSFWRFTRTIQSWPLQGLEAICVSWHLATWLLMSHHLSPVSL